LAPNSPAHQAHLGPHLFQLGGTAKAIWAIAKCAGNEFVVADPGPELMGANTLIGDHVHNHKDEHLGDVKEIMLDTRTGRVAYAVLSCGGVFSIGEKLFAVPWAALKLDTVNKRFVLNVEKARFENALGFNSDSWPNMADQSWVDRIHNYYGISGLSPKATEWSAFDV
jgi:sporulation protein YlmC with PRC-barrel domain